MDKVQGVIDHIVEDTSEADKSRAADNAQAINQG